VGAALCDHWQLDRAELRGVEESLQDAAGLYASGDGGELDDETLLMG
jgi:hypothetical protein